MHLVKRGRKPATVKMASPVGGLQYDAAAVRLMAEILVSHVQARHERMVALAATEETESSTRLSKVEKS